MAHQSKPSPAIDSATAWFAVLEAAKLRNDFERAAEAIRQLRRLGVTVRFSQVSDERKKATADGT